MTTELFVRTQRVGFHQWTGAPDDRAYLRARHRHVFHIEVRMPVAQGDDREIEYHDLLDRIDVLWRELTRSTGGHLSNWSCEHAAAWLARCLVSDYGRTVTVLFSEDGEAGARVTLE